MGSLRLERFKQDRDALQLAVQALEQNPALEKQLTASLAKAIADSYTEIISCAEEGKPFIANVYANAPELFVALGIPWYTISQIPFLPTSEPFILDEIDEDLAIVHAGHTVETNANGNEAGYLSEAAEEASRRIEQACESAEALEWDDYSDGDHPLA